VETAEGWAAGGQLKPEGRLSGWGITGSFVGSLWGLLASFGGAVCVSGWFVAWGLGYGGAFGRDLLAVALLSAAATLFQQVLESGISLRECIMCWSTSGLQDHF
jgi:hypothetical protein